MDLTRKQLGIFHSLSSRKGDELGSVVISLGLKQPSFLGIYPDNNGFQHDSTRKNGGLSNNTWDLQEHLGFSRFQQEFLGISLSLPSGKLT
jgi:hypothetical protein